MLFPAEYFPATGAGTLPEPPHTRSYAVFTEIATRMGLCYFAAVVILAGVMQVVAG